MQQPNLFRVLKIDDYSVTPKYHQIYDGIVEGIDKLDLETGYMLPSINDVSYELDVSRVTVEKAYRKLKNVGIIGSVPGKGYFIAKRGAKSSIKVLLVFNKLSAHKKIVYDEFMAAIGPDASVDFYVYNNDYAFFRKIIENHNTGYTHYVIIPHFLEGEQYATDLINQLTDGQLILMDKCLSGIKIPYKAVIEQFEHDIYSALEQAIPRLINYERLNIIFPYDSYFPREILFGFKNFCREYAFEYRIINQIETAVFSKGDVVINLMEDDLLILLEKARENNFEVGKDLGIISYNETPWKNYILNGVTTISTDFACMGKTAAKMVMNQTEDQQVLPFTITFRNSL